MIHELSRRWGDSLEQKVNRQGMAELYAFGLEVVLIQAISLTVVAVLVVLFGVWPSALIFLAVFFTFRVIGGGVHMAGLGRCLVISSQLIVTCSWLALQVWPTWVSWLVAGLGLGTAILSLWHWVPAGIEQYPLDDPKVRIRRRKQMKAALFLWSLATGICLILGWSEAALALSLGALTSSLLMSPAAYAALGCIDKIMDKRKEVNCK